MLWLGIAVVNIRVTLPLWSNETKLWQWQAGSRSARPIRPTQSDSLLAIAIEHHDRVSAHRLANELLAEKEPCIVCMINVAVLALGDGDLAQAKIALDRAQEIPLIRPCDLASCKLFALATAMLHELQHDDGAEEDYRYATTHETHSSQQRTWVLRYFWRAKGRAAEARVAMDETLSALATGRA